MYVLTYIITRIFFLIEFGIDHTDRIRHTRGTVHISCRKNSSEHGSEVLVFWGDFNPVVRAGHFALPLPTPPWPAPFGTPRWILIRSASATANDSGVTNGRIGGGSRFRELRRGEATHSRYAVRPTYHSYAVGPHRNAQKLRDVWCWAVVVRRV